jgi:hypothetical protein
MINAPHTISKIRVPAFLHLWQKFAKLNVVLESNCTEWMGLEKLLRLWRICKKKHTPEEIDELIKPDINPDAMLLVSIVLPIYCVGPYHPRKMRDLIRRINQ